MKKIALVCLCAMTALSLLTGCSSDTDSENENLGSVELREYRGVGVNVPSVIVTDAEVESRVNQVLGRNPSEKELDRPAREDGVVNIGCVGKQSDIEFVGGTDTGRDLTLGSGRSIERFKDGLIGVKKRDKKELNLMFPETYSEETLVGESVVSEVIVNTVREKKNVVLDDASVRRIFDYKTVDEYKESIKTDPLKQEQQSTDPQVQQSVLQQVVESPTFRLNKTVLSRCYSTRIRQCKEQAKVHRSSLSHTAQANGMDVPGLQEVIYVSVEDDVRSQLVISTVAKHEGIVLGDADHQAFTESSGQDVEGAAAYYGQETFGKVALNYRVVRFMADNASNMAETIETETSTTGTTVGITTAEETMAVK